MNLSGSTIYALASGAGRCGVAVLRLSGPAAGQALLALTKRDLPQPRRASQRRLIDPQSGEIIDHALVLWFPAPHSFTGEDVVELHLHGGRAIIQAVVAALSHLPQLRPAEAGEFTRRAWGHGKLDLTEAEAIADLIHAETEAQRRQALRQFEGGLSQLYHQWSQQLRYLLAYAEADIDFADEDLPADLLAKQQNDIQQLITAVTKHLADGGKGERLRAGLVVAIIGPPNAGKSSLLNHLAAREAAIVSPLAGTTRDVIEVQLDLGGYPVTLLDTAGLRETDDAIEHEGVRRARQRAESADLKLLLIDGATSTALDPQSTDYIGSDSLVVLNKTDLLTTNNLAKLPPDCIAISLKTGAGLPELVQKLVAMIEARFAVTAEPVLTKARHRAALLEYSDHLARALQVTAPELRAEDLRLAMRSLGRITGKVDVEDLLDVIFRDFCIGK